MTITNDHVPFGFIRRFMETKGWWDDVQEEKWKRDARLQVMQAFARAEKSIKPAVKEMFLDVYHEMPQHLKLTVRGMLGTRQEIPKRVPH